MSKTRTQIDLGASCNVSKVQDLSSNYKLSQLKGIRNGLNKVITRSSNQNSLLNNVEQAISKVETVAQKQQSGNVITPQGISLRQVALKASVDDHFRAGLIRMVDGRLEDKG